MRDSQSLLHTLEILLKPFPHEKKSGCKNQACFGGFDKFVQEWGGKILLCNLKSHQYEWVKGIVNKVSSYSQWGIEERAKFVQESEDILIKLREEILLETPVQYLKGVGPRLAEKLARLSIVNMRDLLYHFPRRYEDRSRLENIGSLKRGETVTIKGKVLLMGEERTRRGKKLLKAIVSDGTGKITMIWFSYRGIKKLLPLGKDIIFTGRVEEFSGRCMIHPEFEVVEENNPHLNVGRVIPLYPSTQDITQRLWRKLIFQSIEEHTPFLYDPLPEFIRKKHALPHVSEAMKDIHFPSSSSSLRKARLRFAWEEMFLFQLGLFLKRGSFEKNKGRVLKGKVREILSDILPFSLTASQEEVVKEIERDLNSGKRMYRLLQGEVGSGKTVVALGASLLALKNGTQVAIMAPTLILSEQHYFNFLRYLSPLGYEVVLLTGKEKGKQREKILKKIREGKADVVIGTHALVEEEIKFSSLGLVVIDEQHKFGVMQRSALSFKDEFPHVLVMSATPIPRSLALALYGDMEISTLKEVPGGRGEVETFWIREEERERVYQFMREEISRGRLIYYVVPRIESSGKSELESVEDALRRLKFILPDIPIGVLHGRLKKEEQREIMEKFRKKEFHLLLSTTVIEVGMDVPEATLMVIEDAHNFGLAQLHQLRGRIGRGPYSSYCVLIGNPATEKGYKRLNTLLESKDGFLIAEEDLKLRGPGELLGFKQHGFSGFRIINLLRSTNLIEKVRKEVRYYLEKQAIPVTLLKVIEERFPEWREISLT